MNRIIRGGAITARVISQQILGTTQATSDGFGIGMCLAPKAQDSISSLGQRPRFFGNPDASAESAIRVSPAEKLD